MKKTAIILTLCMLASLVSCGKVDSTEESKPLNIQKSTVSTTTKESQEYESPFKKNSSETQVTGTVTGNTTADGSFTLPVTTVKKGVEILVKRTGIAAPNIPPSRGTVIIPYASNVVKPSKTTATKATPTTVKNTTVKRTGTTVSTGKNTVTTAVTTSPFDVTSGDTLFRIKDNGVEVIRDDKVIQLIETDTKPFLDAYQDGTISSSATLITLGDYDFDGYDDLYIRQGGFGTPNSYGVYMHYNPKTKKFETWEELADIKTTIWIDEENQKLNTSVSGSAVDHESWTYIWNEDKQLQLIENSIQYAVEEDVFIDYFEYPDGEKTLVRREQVILDDEQNIIDTIEIPLVQDPTEATTEVSTENPTEESTEKPTEETTK